MECPQLKTTAMNNNFWSSLFGFRKTMLFALCLLICNNYSPTDALIKKKKFKLLSQHAAHALTSPHHCACYKC